MDQKDIDNRFDYHAPTTDEKRNAHASFREQCRVLATALNESLPDGREKALAITNLEQVMFWGNAALARPTHTQGES